MGQRRHPGGWLPGAVLPVLLGTLLLGDFGWVRARTDPVEPRSHDLIVSIDRAGSTTVGGPGDWIEPDASVVVRVIAQNRGPWARPTRRYSVTSASMDLPRALSRGTVGERAAIALRASGGADGMVFASMLASGETSLDIVRPWAFLHNAVALALAIGTGLSAATAVVSIARRRRRRLSGQCPSCGYNLIDLGPGICCPECGASDVPARRSET